jgi:hypothetical protein
MRPIRGMAVDRCTPAANDKGPRLVSETRALIDRESAYAGTRHITTC